MSGLDKNRFRNTTISFRVSPEERLALEARIKVCGIPKRRVFYKNHCCINALKFLLENTKVTDWLLN